MASTTTASLESSSTIATPAIAKSDAVSSRDVSLLPFLDGPQSNCLNESEAHGIKTILSTSSKNDVDANYLLSDTDEQLLLNIYFNQTVRLRSIAIQTKSAASGPQKIKLFTNKPSLGFEDVEDATEAEASQILELTENNVKYGERIPLRFVRFQNVNSLHIFVASNHGGEDETRIDAIDLFGIPAQANRREPDPTMAMLLKADT